MGMTKWTGTHSPLTPSARTTLDVIHRHPNAGGVSHHRPTPYTGSSPECN